jgi:DNA-binding Lrp family transcriptional regulator
LQEAFPLSTRPFQGLGEGFGLTEAECLERVKRLHAEGLIRHINALFEGRALGYSGSLVALRVSDSWLDSAAALINAHQGVSHNYIREHKYNMWFTIALPTSQDMRAVIEELGQRARAQAVLFLPTVRMFKLQAMHWLVDDGSPAPPERQRPSAASIELTPRERLAVRALQRDLSFVARPFPSQAEEMGLEETELIDIGRGFLDRGIMRRYSAQIHHIKAGLTANGMGCWVVPAKRVEGVGRELAKSPRVTHCYQRPTYPDWPYNLFTMLHAPSREECAEIITELSDRVGVNEYTMLFSTRELKKTRVKYFE